MQEEPNKEKGRSYHQIGVKLSPEEFADVELLSQRGGYRTATTFVKSLLCAFMRYAKKERRRDQEARRRIEEEIGEMFEDLQSLEGEGEILSGHDGLNESYRPRGDKDLDYTPEEYQYLKPGKKGRAAVADDEEEDPILSEAESLDDLRASGSDEGDETGDDYGDNYLDD